ncbi:polysaccharide pyruvyl transferase family protein [Rhizobium sp. CFBP 8762]|uniref:polysaccharide pyruvyl transferase family protein n=1 Tax=Rhizobium sp. CFBP 8762 TaxID=2775279 RepID=UPI00178007F6|nr:polysaccharide pyruvyl transferase family protein [Rhizobium sp. CFBP 8762]MBD8554475.1 polysaccharide pyruvyl transferase family protein [Rhizobium sp. CFBP 8762]
MRQDFAERLNDTAAIPLAWAGSTMDMDYLNFGDALSPVMVALMSGRDITRVPTKSKSLRMGCVGTIGHGFEGGDVYFWGTGCSNWKNPSAPAGEKVKFTVPEGSNFVVTATRGPVSEALLAGPDGDKPHVYGDPVWLLPRFYRPDIKKKWKVGAILHLSELADRGVEAKPRDTIKRFDIPDDLKDDVHLISTVTPISMAAMRDKMDEILACERIVSTSLHGMVIAESYGIPCLYFSPGGPGPGLQTLALDPEGDLDLRIVDLYRGLGQETVQAYVQPRNKPTDWRKVMAAIDQAWKPVTLDEDRLIAAFPLAYNPVVPEEGKTIWEHPALTGLKLQHDVSELRRADKLATSGGAAQKKTSDARGSSGGDQVGAQQVDGSLTPDWPQIPLSWAASTTNVPYANLGDALSAVVVAAISGRPVVHAGFDQPIERMVGVGTIGHAQKNGILHYWGTGLDATRNAFDPSLKAFAKAPDTDYRIHATRGPRTAQVLEQAGIDGVQHVYGDPVWLLPRIWPAKGVKTHRLGVIVHLTELDGYTPEARTKAELIRYGIPPELHDQIRIINTVTERTTAALEERVQEIVACDMILSTSLHGLVIAETYGIPCAWFATYGEGEGMHLDLEDETARIDHRIRDFYLGAGAKTVLTYGLVRDRETPWEDAIRFVAENWTPLSYTADALLTAFPVPVAAVNADGLWEVTPEAESTLNY